MPENNKEEFCRDCGLARPPEIFPGPVKSIPERPVCTANPTGHVWTTEPDFPSDLDMRTLLSASDAADIASLSADQKSEKRRVFGRAIGRMLADITGTTPSEKEAIEYGYAEMCEVAVSPSSFPPMPQSLNPPKPPRSNFIFIKDPGHVSVINFKSLAEQFFQIIISVGGPVEPPSIVVAHADTSTDVQLRGPEAYKFLQYLRSLANHLDAIAVFVNTQPNMMHMSIAPAEHAAEIRELLAVPQIQSLLSAADQSDGCSASASTSKDASPNA